MTKKETELTIQEFLLDVYSSEKETAFARIRGTEKGLAVIQKVSELWTPEDRIHADELLIRMRRLVIHLNALKIIVSQHQPDPVHGTMCFICMEDGQTIAPMYPCNTLRWLAMPYLDYPKFNPTWAVAPEQFEDLSLLHRKELHDSVEMLREQARRSA